MFPTSALEMILSIVLSNLLWIPNVKPKPKSLMSSINLFNSKALYLTICTTGPKTSFFKSLNFFISIKVGGINYPKSF